VIAEHTAAFDLVLAARPAQLVGDDGRILPVAPQRWLAPAGGEDGWLLNRCTGPTVDLGCGPGAIAELPALTALATLAGLQTGDRYRAGRCFIELRYVNGW